MSFKPYPAYTDSGVEWLGKVPEGWGISKVNTGYEIQLGKMLQNNSQSPEDMRISYLRAYNVAWEKIISDDIATMWASPRDIEQYAVHVGDLLVCEGGEAARCAILQKIESPTIIQNALHRVRPRKGFSNHFLMYYLIHCAATGWFEVLCNKATIVHFTVDKFSHLELLLPPLPEQQAIVAFLDHETARIDALIAAQEKLIALLKEKRQALISHAVTRGLNPEVKLKDSGVEWLGMVPEGWAVKKLKHVTTKIIDGAHFTPTYVEEGVPFFRVTDIQEFPINLNEIKRIPSEEHVELTKRCDPQYGDILLSKNGTIGLTRIVDWNFEFSIFVSLCLIRPNNLIYHKYLQKILSSNLAFEQYKDSGKQTSVTNLHLEKIKELFIILPPLPEQQAIVAFLDTETAKIDTLVAEAQKGIALLKERRSAVISAAVTGQIDVRDWVAPEGAA